MKTLFQLLLLFAAIAQVEREVVAKTLIKFGPCEIGISEFADKDLTQISQTAMVRDTNTGFIRTIETYKLTSFSLTDFPLPGIDTFIIREWSGGMTCCYFDYVITYKKSSGRTQFQIISSGRGEAEIPPPGMLRFVENKPALEVVDSFWMPDQVWWPRWKICHAASPIPTRLVVFDADLLLWEDTTPKHFKGFYERKYAEAVEEYKRIDPNDDQGRFSLAVEAAYYAYMAGESKARLDRLLNEMVPKEHRDKRNKSTANIRQRIIQRANDFQAADFWLPDSGSAELVSVDALRVPLVK